MNLSDKILITGSTGLIGSALKRLLSQQEDNNLLTPTSGELDLRFHDEVVGYIFGNLPGYVFHLAAKVGGIQSNRFDPVDYIVQNTLMQTAVITACAGRGVKKLLFPGSACAYPRNAPQPIREESFLEGKPEETNIAYAAAKINGIIMAQSYAKQFGMNVVLPMVANTYGLDDHFESDDSHVIPALMKKFHNAKRDNLSDIVLWGSGKAEREFIFADDVAEAFVFLMQNYDSPEIINVGTGDFLSIADLAYEIAYITQYKGRIVFDASKPDGAMRKVLDCTRINALGWKAKTRLTDGLRRVYDLFVWRFRSMSLRTS